MSRIKYIPALGILFILLMGCEKVITVDIKDTSMKYVIEGVINDDSTCRVRISRTSNFYDTLDLTGISNAVVTLTEAGEDALVLRETTDAGVYRATATGVPGHSYTLNVKIDTLEFTATSTMPQKVELDSLYVTERVFLGKDRMFATVQFKDPPETGNAYKFVQYVNGNQETNIFVLNDVLVNNRTVVNDLLIYDDEYTLYKCDQLRVVMECIDQPMYTYWYSLNQSALGSSQSASPGNPATNIQGGALGYFSAYTASSLNIAVAPDSSCSYSSD
ncbi:MAG: DUF4249 domain-containing protein [Niabella sp.]